MTTSQSGGSSGSGGGSFDNEAFNRLESQILLNREIEKNSGLLGEIREQERQISEQRERARAVFREGSEEQAREILQEIELLKEKKGILETNLSIEQKAQELGKINARALIAINTPLLELAQQSGGAFGVLSNAAKGFLGEFDSFGKIAILALDKLITTTREQIKVLDEAAASFVQTTGASRDFAITAYETRQDLGYLGITGQQAVGTMGLLYGSFNEFTQLSKSAQKDFIVLAAQINKLGGDAGGMAQVFTKVANVSISQTEENLRLVAGAADALGVPLSQMSDNIAGMSELFAKMGQAGMDTFLELSAAAKATGLSVQELYGIVSKYDTFEGASAAAGRLNMVLGGNLLDTYSLLSASEEERIALLQDALALSGQTFEEMDRFQRIEIADALGISLQEAAQLFQTTRGEVEQTAAELMHAGMSQEELEQRTRDAATAMDKFSVLMGNLALFVEPIVEGLNSIINGFLSLTRGLPSTVTAILTLVTGLLLLRTAAFFVVQSPIGKITSLISRISGAASRAGNAIRSAAGPVSSGLNSMGSAAGASSGGFLKFGASMLLVGVAIGAVLLSLGYLISQFKEMSPEQISAVAKAMLFLSGAVVVLGVALGLMGQFAAVVGIGAGILVATVAGLAAALSLVGKEKIESFNSLFSTIAENASEFGIAGDGLASLAGGVSAFVAAITGLSAISALSRVGFSNVLSVFNDLSSAINLIDEEKLQSITSLISYILEVSYIPLFDNRVAIFIRELGSALNEFPNIGEQANSLSTSISLIVNSLNYFPLNNLIPVFINELGIAINGLPDIESKLSSYQAFFSSISELNQVLQQLPEGVGNLQSLAASLELIKSLSQELTPGGGIAATIQEIGTALDELPVNTEKFQSYSNIFNSLAELAQDSLQGGNIPALIREINSALEEFPDDTTKVMAFKTTADSLADLARISSTIEETQLENIKLIIDSISNSNGNENFERIANSIAALVEGRGGAETNPGAPIVIEIDGRVLGRWVDRRFKTAITRITN